MNYYNLLFVLPFCFLVSCGSDNLNKKLAKSLINDCPNNPYTSKVVSFYTGVRSLKFSIEKIPKYENLQSLGLVNFIKKGDRYLIELTDKGKEFLVDHKDPSLYKKINANPKNKVYVKSSTYILEEVNEVQEMLQMNLARVNSTFKLVEKTPFSTLLAEKNQPKERFTKDLEFRKTTEGWKFCKN